MRALKWIAITAGILFGCVLLVVAAALALNYRPGSVEGKSIDPGPVASLDGGALRLADYTGRVVLIAFATNS